MVNPSNQEAEEAVPEQPRVQRETLSQKKQKQKKKQAMGLRKAPRNKPVRRRLWALGTPV